MFTAAIPVIAKIWEQPKSSQKDVCINLMVTYMKYFPDRQIASQIRQTDIGQNIAHSDKCSP